MRQTPTRCVLIAFALMASVVTLASCDKLKQASDTAGAATEQASSTSEEEKMRAKFNAYTNAFNKLVDDQRGVRYQYKQHVQNDPASRDPAETILLSQNIIGVEQALSLLREGRAMEVEGDLARAADADVDALTPTLEKLLSQWRDLKSYFDTKAYRDDGLARLKAADAGLRADYEACLVAISSLDATLTDYGRARAQTRIADLKKGGNMPRYHAAKSMYTADLLITAVSDDDFAQADTLLPQVEGSLSELAVASGAMDDGGDEGSDKRQMGQIHLHLSRMVGEYRDYRASKNPEDGSTMIEHYNNAIEASNDLD